MRARSDQASVIQWFGALVGCVILSVGAYADGKPRAISIIGRNAVVVSTPIVRVEDIADVSSTNGEDDDAVIALKKIEIGRSPSPGQASTLAASTVLEGLTAAKVNLENIGYRFPETIAIRRAGRLLTSTEVQSAIEGYFSSAKREITVRGISYDGTTQIAPGDVTISAEPLYPSPVEQQRFALHIIADGEPEKILRATAQIEEWREVAVAVRPIGKGSVVAAEDVTMARLNVLNLPRGLTDNPGEVIGRATSVSIAAGEPLMMGKLSIPPLINAGEKVTLVVRGRSFEATATGIAMQAGIEGAEIRVRNESSKKVVSGTVNADGLVIVDTQGAAR